MNLSKITNDLQLRWLALAAILVGLPGCRAIAGIFKAGVWVGVVAVVFIAALLFGVAKLFSGRSSA